MFILFCAGAATSASLGALQSENWVFDVVGIIFSFLGAETGRYLIFTGSDVRGATGKIGTLFFCLWLSLSIFQLSWMYTNCDEDKVVAANETGLSLKGFAGGYECINSDVVIGTSAAIFLSFVFALFTVFSPFRASNVIVKHSELLKKLR